MEKLDNYSEQAIALAVDYAPKLAMALLTLVVGWIIISSVVKLLKKLMKKRDVDESLVPFLSSLFNVLLKAMLQI